MSADPDPLPPPSEPVSPPEELSTGARGFKRRYKKPDPAGQAAGVDHDGEIIVLSSLLQNLLERKQGNGSANEQEVRAKVNRFVQRGNNAVPLPLPSVPDSGEPPSVPPNVQESAAPPQDVNPPKTTVVAALPKFEPRASVEQPAGWERTGSTWGRGVLYFAFAAALALLAFLAGRNNADHADAAHRSTGAAPFAPWEPAYARRLDKALAADHVGDLHTALQLTDALQKDMGNNPTLVAYRATLGARLGHPNDAEVDISHALNSDSAPDVAAPLNEADGFVYTRRRDFDEAIACFQTVAELEPFNTPNLLHLGEAMRRKGRLNEAIATFQTALTRLPTSPDASTLAQREYLAYETRLTQVESGHGADLQAEIDRHLGAPAPSAYWLLTAAARALQDRNVPPAVDALTKARALLPGEEFTALLGDYFFQTFSFHPELNAFFPVATPEQQKARLLRMDYFIDP